MISLQRYWKGILLTIVCLFILICPVRDTYGEVGGFLDLIRDTYEKPKDEMIGRFYRYGNNSQSQGTCEGYFKLMQFYEPNYFVFSYSYTPPRSRFGPAMCGNNGIENGTLIMVKVPSDMFKEWRRNSGMLGFGFVNINWAPRYAKDWGLNKDSQYEFSREYVVKDISEVTKTDGTVAIVPIIEHLAISLPPEEFNNFKKAFIEWREEIKAEEEAEKKRPKKIAESFMSKGRKIVRYEGESEWFCTRCGTRFVLDWDAKDHRCENYQKDKK